MDGSANAIGRLARFLPALASMLLVGWIWHLPQTLVAADGLADRSIRQQIRNHLAREGSVDLEARTDQWLHDKAAQVDAARRQQVQRWRESLSFQVASGRRYPYLGDLDSYAWVREAQNYLRQGSTCDELTDGICRDTFVNPPHGIVMPYRRSLHIGAIVAVHKLSTWLNPEIPLTTSAAWVAILGGMLSSLLAFVVARRMAGVVAGTTAALLIPLHPFVLARCLGSDNDVWVVLLPILLAWSTAATLEATQWNRRLPLLLSAAFVTGLYAMTWGGWILHAGATFAGAAISVGADWLVDSKDPRQRRARSAALVLLILAASLSVGWLAGFHDAGFRLGEFLRGWISVAPSAPATADTDVWPPMFATVSELERMPFAKVVTDFFGDAGWTLGFAGFALLLIPRTASGQVYLGALLYGLLITASSRIPGLNRSFYLSALFLPAIALFAWALRRDDDMRERSLDRITAAWFIAAIGASFWGTRYVLLLVTPMAMAVAIVFGRTADRLTSLAARRDSTRSIFPVVALATLLALLSPYISRGYTVAATYTPVLNSAWGKVFDHLRNKSPDDAIVTSWWDYGYWVKYLAARRTTNDGASLHSHRPYWVARTLVSQDPQEAIGLLRMLNCGGDDSQSPEASPGAFGLIQSVLKDPIRSRDLLLDLVRRPYANAANRLDASGFAAAQKAQILAATHCDPPQSYLLLSDRMAGANVWMRIGTWDFRKAFLVDSVRKNRSNEEIIREASARLGFAKEEAIDLVDAARHTRQFDFVSGKESRTPPVWFPCNPGPSANTLRCPVALEQGTTGIAIEEASISLLDPLATRFRVSAANQAAWQERIPAVLLMADRQVVSIPVQPDPEQDLGMLVDVQRRRVLLGQPAFLTSLFVRLVYLDGRDTPGFERIVEETSLAGERISLWRVSFPLEAAAEKSGD